LSTRIRPVVIVVLLLGALVPIRAGAAPAVAPGHLDPNFGYHGKVVETVATGGPKQDGATFVRPLPDGTFLVADWADRAGSRDFAILKFYRNGTLDKHFGKGDGITYTDFHGGLDYPASIALAPNGRILVGGCAGHSSGSGCDDFALARYTSDGVLDPTFGGGDGKVNTDFHGGADFANAMAIMPNGDIALAGDVSSGPGAGPFTIGVAMYKPKGTLDTSFSGDGKASGFGPVGIGAYGVVALPNGELIAAGSDNDNVILEKFKANGALDPNYGTGGVATVDFGQFEALNAMIGQSNGAVVLGGSSTTASNATRFLLAKIRPNGSPDLSFGSGGRTITSFGAKNDAYISGLVEQPDGKYVAAGQYLVSGASNYDFAVARYTSNGKLDPSFGSGGMATVGFGLSYDYAYGVGVLKNGDVIAAGQKGNHTALAAFAGDAGPQCTLVGTASGNTLLGSAAPDVLCGLGGNDTLKGLGDDDFLFGGPGNDTLNGGPGTDTCNQGTGTGPRTFCEH
jgi:uncharacterized delta-60 repeat protein